MSPPPTTLRFGAAPALRAGLQPAAEGATWQVDRVLFPGLAAEASEALRRLPLAPHALQAADAAGFHWRCDAELPASPDPQLPEALFQLRRAVDVDLPALIGGALGRTLRPARPGVLSVWWLQKGCWYHDTPSPDGPVRYLLSLTGARWPASWGGHLDVGGALRPLGWDQLTVLGPGEGIRLPLVRRHIAALLLLGELVG